MTRRASLTLELMQNMQTSSIDVDRTFPVAVALMFHQGRLITGFNSFHLISTFSFASGWFVDRFGYARHWIPISHHTFARARLVASVGVLSKNRMIFDEEWMTKRIGPIQRLLLR